MDTSRLRIAVKRVGRAPEVWQCIRQLENWPAILPAYVGLRTPTLPLTQRTRFGMAFDLEEFGDVETLWQIYCRHVYEVRCDDRVIVDAGANIGLFSCYAAMCAPHARIHAVEPFPRTFDRLLRTVHHNHLEHRIVCHNVALSSSSGVSTMSTRAPASQMFHLVEGPPGNDPGVTVRTTTLASLIGAIDVPTIDLLKMDIEGMEYDVLLSAPPDCLHRIRRINVEFHLPPAGCAADKRTLARHFSLAGFKLLEDPAAPDQYGIFHFWR